ncbi:MAG TPA: NlpC/P60 family protein [Candidatus Paceibacterota bacterium]
MYDQLARKRELGDRGYDHRVVPWRSDIAAATLEGTLNAVRYAKGEQYQVTAPSVSLRFAPESDSAVETQLLFGETFIAYDVDLVSGFAWGQAELDGHVGFVRLSGLNREARESTHRVAVPSCPVLPRPDRKAKPAFTIPFNARVTVLEQSREDPIYVSIGDGFWVFVGDLSEVGIPEEDPLSCLQPLAGVSSYLWGFRNVEGFDCSGMVQALHVAQGRRCLRDADQQEEDATFGEVIPFDESLSGLRRFDHVYFPGHVAVMLNSSHALHAKGENVRKLIIERIRDIDRWRSTDCEGGARTIKRFS